MSQDIDLRHEFLEFIPDELKEGTIYISIRFASAVHLCCCGCGNRVVTPLRPTDWKLIFDGKTISLEPSIGNWSFPCQSHYWIRRNRVKWATQWSQEEIAAGRAHDSLAKGEYFGSSKTPPVRDADASALRPAQVKPTQSVWQKLKRWLVG